MNISAYDIKEGDRFKYGSHEYTALSDATVGHFPKMNAYVRVISPSIGETEISIRNGMDVILVDGRTTMEGAERR